VLSQIDPPARSRIRIFEAPDTVLSMPDITLRALIENYVRHKMADDLDGNWGTLVAYRPIAIVLAWPLCRVGVPPIAVTIAACGLLPAMAVVAIVAPPTKAILGLCALGVLYWVVDCIDGTIARALGRESKFGYYADLSTDLLYRVVFYGALGHVADRLTSSESSVLLSVALMAAWLSLFARTARLYSEKLSSRPAPLSQHSSNHISLLSWIYLAVSGIDALLPFTALAFWWFDIMPLLPFWLLIYGAADAVHTQVTTMLAVRRL